MKQQEDLNLYKITSTLKKGDKILINTFIFLIGLFPILPFHFKSAIVVALLILVITSLKSKKGNVNYIFIINATLFISYLLSLFYTQDFSRGLHKLEIASSLLILPLCFIILSKNKDLSQHLIDKEDLFKQIFILASFCLSILILIISLKYGDYINLKVDLNLLSLNLDKGFYWLKDHPIYISIYLSLSLLMIVSLYPKKGSVYYKLYLLFAGIFQLFILLLLSRKGVIMSFIISWVIFIIINSNKKTMALLLVVAFSFLTIVIVFKYTPDTVKRFKEIVDEKSYTKVERFSSTSIRYAIYNCSIEKASNNLFLGYGIGGANKELKNCYLKTSDVLVGVNYNSHNQFLATILRVGIIGFILFLISLIFNLRLFFLNNDYFAFCMLLMFILFMLTENILDRQNGVILFSFLINYFAFKNIITPIQKKRI